jgi:23S rRNA (uracil1939-C5)-methyltransferase
MQVIKMQQCVSVHDIITFDVKRMGINGEGIGYYEKLAIFVEQALPGESIEAEITEVFPNRANAKIKRIIKPSKDRIVPFCPVYDACGGCQVQHFNYRAMLAQKKDILRKSFDRYLPNYPTHIFKDTVGMKNPMNYRNKASLPIRKVKGKTRFGMYARNSNQFIPIEDCGVQHPMINQIFTGLVQLIDELKIEAYDPKTKKGYLTHVVVRITEHKEEVQVSFITLKRMANLMVLAEELVKKFPKIKSIFEVVNSDTKRQTFFTEDIRLIYGKEMIDETLNGFNFSLKPEAFFQLNTTQAEKFYQKMNELANLKEDEIAIDAYAGIAPISHYIASNAKKVYAIELDKGATTSAKESLKRNKIQNVEVIQSDFAKALKNLPEKHIDVMLFDPPRTGLGHETIELIKKYKPKRLVYGSCNPSTLAKDLNELISMYDIKEVVPFDMFPFTSLVESVTLLELKH